MEFFVGGGSFHSQGQFSQLRGIFAAHFTTAKWECGVAKWHSCAKGVFRRGFHSCEMGLWLRNEALGALDGFVDGFTSAKWGLGLRNGTHVPRGCFAAAKIFAGGGAWAAK